MSTLQRLIRLLMPDESRFFDYIVAVAETSHRSALRLLDIAQAPTTEDRLRILPDLRQAERDGDTALRTIANALDETFVTPIDREDLYHLAHALEGISDFVASTASQLDVHHMEKLPEGTLELSRILVEATQRCQDACIALRQGGRSDEIRAACADIERLEREADETFRRQMGLLFTHQSDAIELLKAKEFLEGLENSVDRCADVAKVLGAVLVKTG